MEKMQYGCDYEHLFQIETYVSVKRRRGRKGGRISIQIGRRLGIRQRESNQIVALSKYRSGFEGCH